MGDGEYSVSQAADLAGLSVRALHHFESLGLIAPARRKNGYRTYTSDDMRKLQQVLVYRACGMRLADIAKVVGDPAYDARAALCEHLEALKARRATLDELIHTVEKTIREIEGECEMTDEQRFAGLKRSAIEENERMYGKEARMRYGDEAVDAANEALLAMSAQEWADKDELEAAIIEALIGAMAQGDPAGELSAQLADMHARWLQMQWGPGRYTPQAHVMLAQGYLADERFVEYYDSRAGAGATEFLVAAIKARLGN